MKPSRWRVLRTCHGEVLVTQQIDETSHAWIEILIVLIWGGGSWVGCRSSRPLNKEIVEDLNIRRTKKCGNNVPDRTKLRYLPNFHNFVGGNKKLQPAFQTWETQKSSIHQCKFGATRWSSTSCYNYMPNQRESRYCRICVVEGAILGVVVVVVVMVEVNIVLQAICLQIWSGYASASAKIWE